MSFSQLIKPLKKIEFAICILKILVTFAPSLDQPLAKTVNVALFKP